MVDVVGDEIKAVIEDVVKDFGQSNGCQEQLLALFRNIIVNNYESGDLRTLIESIDPDAVHDSAVARLLGGEG